MDKNQVHVIYGNEPVQMVKSLFSKIELEKDIDKEMLIGLKPNLVVARPSEQGATTSPQLVEGIIQYLQEKGFSNIIILEGSWVGDSTRRAFKVCGYEEISQKYNVPLFDLKKDEYQEFQVGGQSIKICQKALEVDYLIDLPVLKAHCQTRFTCALKNLKGCIPDSEKRSFHSRGLSNPIAALAKALPVGLVVVDAINGDLTFEEGGNPVQMNRIIVGKDPVLVDTYGASLIGYSYTDIKHIDLAAQLGVGSIDLNSAQIFEYNTGEKSGTSFKPSRKAKKLARYIVEKEACSACYGSLIHALQRLDEMNYLNNLNKIYIGQGFQDQTQEGIGVGRCTAEFSKSVPGCPPPARAIVEYLIKEF